MIGVVCAGAGARGAYEAGALSKLLPWLIRHYPQEPLVMLGTSAGAINTALFSAMLDRQRPPEDSVQDALSLWTSARPSQVFTPLCSSVPPLALRYGLEVLGLPVRIDSLLDSSPLRRTMEQEVDWTRLDRNLSGSGFVHAAAVVATDCDAGRSAVFVQGPVPDPPSDPIRGIDYRRTTIRAPHVQASAAIPVAFLPVQLTDAGRSAWYLDGGIRQNAPIRPALALGADQVIVVATTPDPDLASPPAPDRQPDVFGAAAVTLRALLVDRMAEDVRHLRQVNALVGAAGTDPLPVPGRDRAYSRVRNLYVGPRRPDAIAQAARRIFDRYYGGPAGRLSDLGALAALLGGVGDVHGELFSFLFFDGRFHAELIRMGARDAERAIATGWNVV